MNETLTARIDAIFDSLNAAYDAGVLMSSASKGAEREIFVTNVLQQVFPPHFRFSSGDIVDSSGRQSGQIDVVLEKPLGYSFPLAYVGPRLFLAENVGAVIEVKSNLSGQWPQVIKTAEKVAVLQRIYASENWQEIYKVIESNSKTGNLKFEGNPEDRDEALRKVLRALDLKSKDKKNIGERRIPFIVVGFTGWSKDTTVIEKLVDGLIDGIMVLDTRKYYTKYNRPQGQEAIAGSASLLAMLHRLEIEFRAVERFPAHSEYFS